MEKMSFEKMSFEDIRGGVHARMSKIKYELSKCKIPKSGHNKFSGFRYHELTDFMPFINELNYKHGVNASVFINDTDRIARIMLTNTDDAGDCYMIRIPFVEAEMLAKGGAPSVVDAIQRLGSTVTYIRRYLLMTAYDITENDGVDSLEQSKPSNVAKPPITTERVKKAIESGAEAIKQLTDIFELTQEQKNMLP